MQWFSISRAFLYDTPASHSLIRRVATGAIDDTERGALVRERKGGAEHQYGQALELLELLDRLIAILSKSHMDPPLSLTH